VVMGHSDDVESLGRRISGGRATMMPWVMRDVRGRGAPLDGLEEDSLGRCPGGVRLHGSSAVGAAHGARGFAGSDTLGWIVSLGIGDSRARSGRSRMEVDCEQSPAGGSRYVEWVG
jgi:hypothetical protein